MAGRLRTTRHCEQGAAGRERKPRPNQRQLRHEGSPRRPRSSGAGNAELSAASRRRREPRVIYEARETAMTRAGGGRRRRSTRSIREPGPRELFHQLARGSSGADVSRMPRLSALQSHPMLRNRDA